MKAMHAVGLVLIGAGTCLYGGPTEDAILAAMKLSNHSNYSWRSTVTDDAQTYEIEGKTETGHYSWQRSPMVKSIARRLGRGADDMIEAIFKGPQEYVIRTEDGWRTLDELPEQHPDWNGDGDIWYVPVVPPPIAITPDMPADTDPLAAPPPVVYHPVVRSGSSEKKTHSNIQFARHLPHEELAVIVSSECDLKVEGDVASGNLTNTGAQLLLVHEGHEYIKPVVAAGRFKLWIENDVVVKYQVDLGGIVLIKDEPIHVHQASVTRLTNIGTTKLEIPADARRRLDSIVAATQ